ncbi:MAG: hypothetical protein EXS32_16030 [Opitutus sp.]|nr:hypothetical protein [Opitutus sp.]
MASSPPDNPSAPAPAGAIFLSYAREDIRLRQDFRRRQGYGGQVGGQADAIRLRSALSATSALKKS